jgi:primase-polymerase (primpol)-like protein
MNNPPIADGSRINPAIAELAAIPRWVVWRLEWRLNKKTGEKDSTKVPYTTGLRHASSIDPKTWDSFENCRLVAFEAGAADGVGIVLDGNDDLIGVDLDDCLERDGTLTPWAKAIAERLNSYTEITPSGRGVRIFVRGALPPGRRKKGDTEIYSSGRFLTVTGNRRPEFPNRIRCCPKAIAAVFNKVFGDTPAPPDRKPNGHADVGELPEPAPDIARYLKLFPESDYASPSERDLAVACAMARHGRTDQRIAAVLRALRAGETKADRRDYIERTICQGATGNRKRRAESRALSRACRR